MVNRFDFVEEINLSDDEDERWKDQNCDFSPTEIHNQEITEEGIWTNEYSDSYYNLNEDEQATENYGSYYDEVPTYNEDQLCYYDENEGIYVYYDNSVQSSYDDGTQPPVSPGSIPNNSRKWKKSLSSFTSSSFESPSGFPSTPAITVSISSDDDDESEEPPIRFSNADDSDEDPHFRVKSVVKSRLPDSSRKLRPKKEEGEIHRVSEGKVMSRKRFNKSASSSKSVAVPEPDLVCLDSDEDDEIPLKKKNRISSLPRSTPKFQSQNFYRPKSRIRHEGTKSMRGSVTERGHPSMNGFECGSSSKTVIQAPPTEIVLDDDAVETIKEPRTDLIKNDGIKSQITSQRSNHKIRRDRNILMPVFQYYYGWSEGKTEPSTARYFRFRCSREGCAHVSFDNVAAMRHAVGHINFQDTPLESDIFSDFIRCPTCFEPFKTRYEIQCHYEAKHAPLATKSKGPHRCKICERDIDGQERFIQHMRRFHVAKDLPYVCPVCSYRSSVYNMVLDHFLASHAATEESLCPFCLKSFPLLSDDDEDENSNCGDTKGYLNHLAEHTIKKRHKCQQCRLIFLKGTDLSLHVQCDHKTAKGKIEALQPTSSADYVKITVAEAISPSEKSSPSKIYERSRAILAHFSMTLGQRAGPQSVSAEGLKAWNLRCIECHRPLDFAGHFRTVGSLMIIRCDRCAFSTTCSFTYAKHMILFHGTAADRMKIVARERKIQFGKLRCRGCSFESNFGDRMCRHVIDCSLGSKGASIISDVTDMNLVQKNVVNTLSTIQNKLAIKFDSNLKSKPKRKKSLAVSDGMNERLLEAKGVVDDLLALIDPVGTVLEEILVWVEKNLSHNKENDRIVLPAPTLLSPINLLQNSSDEDQSNESGLPEVIALSDSDDD